MRMGLKRSTRLPLVRDMPMILIDWYINFLIIGLMFQEDVLFMKVTESISMDIRMELPLMISTSFVSQ